MTTKTGVLTGRLMRHILRSPDTIITVALIPIAMLLLFVYVFGGALAGAIPAGTNYATYMLPGIIVMAVASGISYTAYRMYQDTQAGIFDRFNAMPISRASALWAHVLTSVVSNLMTIALIFLVGLAVGFRTHAGPGAWLAVAGLLVLFTLALTWVAVIPGITATSMEGASAFAYPLIFLPFLSSAFVPVETMPRAVRLFATYQPVTPIVNTIRHLFAGTAVGNDGWVAVVWCLGIGLVAYVLALRAYNRRALAR